MKILYTLDNKTKEGYEVRLPGMTSDLDSDSVDEILGENVIEKVGPLVDFINECYRILRKGGKAIFISPYFASARAWSSPLNVRGVCEYTLNFASKTWRDGNNYTETPVIADFEVNGQFAIEDTFNQRSDEARMFAVKHYNNVAQNVILTLTK